MDEINYYFNNLDFTKFEVNETYTSYICAVRTYDQTSKQKYVTVYVLNKDAKLDSAKLKQLRWFSVITTDMLNLSRNVPLFQFYKSQKDADVSKDKVLHMIDRDYLKSVYKFSGRQIPLTVTLLHNEKKKTSFQFPETLTLHQALDTYKCIVRRTDF